MTNATRFERGFPWRPEDVQDLKKLALSSSVGTIKLRWYWEPFHRAGFNALNYAQKKQMSAEAFSKRIQNLSCPAPPKWLSSKILAKMKQEKVLGDDGELKFLDVTPFIQKTFEEARGQISAFDRALLLTISDLKKLLTPDWSPEISSLAEVTEVSKWLTNEPRLMNRFHEMKGWEALELLESLSGMFNSSSVLNITRIYRK